MRKHAGPFSYSVLLCLMSLFLAAAGISRYIETDSGNILIHDIEAESWEGFVYGGRLFRPLQANSLNQRPSVLLIAGAVADRYTCDHIAMELARRGFVVLSMEDFSQGSTGPEPDFETENLVDAGFAFLNTRSFTDHGRIGVAAFYSGAEKLISAKAYPKFASAALIAPPAAAAKNAAPGTRIYAAEWESSPEFRLTKDHVRFYASSHAGMLTGKAVLAGLMQQFHEELAIPNDSPFWFDPESQRAPVLIGLRFLLLILLTVVCTGFSGRISGGGSGAPLLRTVMGIVLPLALFLGISETMNFFLISVRIGSPFSYLPGLSRLLNGFSPLCLAGFAAAALLWSLPVGQRRSFYLADIFSVLGSILCLAGFLPLFFCGRSGWEIAGVCHLRWSFALFAFLSCFDSLLLRTVPRQKRSVICLACVTGAVFYIICSCLPAGFLFQETIL